MDGEADRIEVRDGRTFKVTVLPERVRGARRKPIRTREDVRAQMMAERAGLGMDGRQATPGQLPVQRKNSDR